jgi:hypothetical protein
VAKTGGGEIPPPVESRSLGFGTGSGVGLFSFSLSDSGQVVREEIEEDEEDD